MLRTGLLLAAILTGMSVCLSPVMGAESDTPTTLRFVQGLRERGYYDLAIDYLEQLRAAPDTPADLRVVLDYEMGRSLLEQASHAADLELKRQQLDLARTKLEAFTKANPNHPLATEALSQLGYQLIERGHLAMLQGDEAKAPEDKQIKLAEARDFFHKARASYDQAEGPLKKAYESFPKFLAEGDPARAARDRAHVAIMNAQLQRALVDYEEAQTYAPGSKERIELLDKGIGAFKAVYQDHRTQMAGLYARMWQGKCYEEKGDLGPAMGVYNELMDHPDSRLRPLQRQVGFFRILVIGKRKEYALAADEAARWLQANPNSRHSREGLGVLLELAKNILAQLEGLKGAEHDAAVRRATDALGELVRYSSPYKPEALALLQKYRPRAAASATIPANLTYDDAMGQADIAIASQEWDRAISLLKAAVRRADPTKEPEKANRARYLMAFCYYQNEHYYEAVVIADHLARRYPNGGLSAKSTEIGMAALTFAYNTFVQRDRTADLNHLIELAKYTAETWPETEQGDAARMTLGEIYLGQGSYADAAKMFQSVRPASSRHADGQGKAGLAHWRQSVSLREKEKTDEADTEAKTAQELLQAALKTRHDAGASSNDPGLISNASDLAEIYLATDRAKDALNLLDPLSRAQGTAAPPAALVPLVSRLLASELRAHIGVGQVEMALADMKRLETLGGSGANLTQLYYELGRMLKKEMDTLQARGDQAGYDRTQQAYLKFLEALVASKAGQSYDSLQWAGESMLSLSQGAKDQAGALRVRRMVREAKAISESARSMAAEASTVFQRVIETYSKDESFMRSPSAEARLLRARLRLVTAYRLQSEFDKAAKLLNDLIEQNKGILDPLMEKGFLLEDEAVAEDESQPGRGNWARAYEHWNRLAARLRQSNPRPKEYYEATYQVAWVLLKQDKKQEAKQTLNGVMRLSPTVGGPDMKAKYETLLKQLDVVLRRA